jgi:hypothetical protein
MKITKRQLRRIIKEEKSRLLKEEYGMGKSAEEDMMSLVNYLEGAIDRAAYMRTALSASGPAYAETARGNEALDLAGALEEIWIEAGFDPSEIFK